MRESKIGKKRAPFSEEWKEKISKSLMGNSYALGHKHTDEVKRMCRERLIKNIGNRKSIHGNSYPMAPNIGKYENQIMVELEKLFNYTILRQHRVVGYFLDGYIPELNLAIEVDEKHHNKLGRLKKDKYREGQINKELDCQFLRINALKYERGVINGA